MRPALQLNATFEPMELISWQKTMTLVIKQKAFAVETYDRVVRSANDTWELPSVIRLKSRVQIPKRPVPFNRVNVYRRDGFTCQYCGEEFDYDDLTFDHVVPQSRDGRTTWENIVTACGPCNHSKGNRTPSEAGMTLFSEPKDPGYMPFSISSKRIDNFCDNWKRYLWN